jgi:hypothetical protein
MQGLVIMQSCVAKAAKDFFLVFLIIFERKLKYNMLCNHANIHMIVVIALKLKKVIKCIATSNGWSEVSNERLKE